MVQFFLNFIVINFQVQSREKYDVIIPTWCNVYLILHFIATVISFQDLAQRYLVSILKCIETFISMIVHL